MNPETVTTDTLPEALRLLFGDLAPGERESRVEYVQAMAASGELDTRGILILRQSRRVVGVILSTLLPGAGGLLWPPVVLPNSTSSLEWEDLLIEGGLSYLRHNGAKLAQALVEEEWEYRCTSLLRHGFRLVTWLHYLQRDINKPIPVNTASRLRYEAYSQGNARIFAETLFRTYDGTLDCPEVNGVRTPDEVMTGHQAQGNFKPALWWLVRLGEIPVGVMMQTDLQGGDREICYVGTVPEQRRRGFAKEMLLRSLEHASAAKAAGVVLCVDERNTPARRLYANLGFNLQERKAVVLTVWGSAQR